MTMHAIPSPDAGAKSIAAPRSTWDVDAVVDVVSIVDLERAKIADPGLWQRFQEAVNSISTSESLTLIARIETATDALILWELHRELDRRGIPPVLRFPKNQATMQMEYVTWLADVYWFTRHKPRHKPEYATFKPMFGPISDGWHKNAIRLYTFAFRRGYGATYFTRGFALNDADRRPLMTIKSTRQIARLRTMKHAPAMRMALLSYATANPDKSGTVRPDECARRRYAIWKTYVLIDRSETAAARYYALIYGESITRQALGKQIAAAKVSWASYGNKAHS